MRYIVRLVTPTMQPEGAHVSAYGGTYYRTDDIWLVLSGCTDVLEGDLDDHENGFQWIDTAGLQEVHIPLRNVGAVEGWDDAA